jgi:voltage-gated potassium channel
MRTRAMPITGKMTKHVQLLTALVATEMLRPLLSRADFLARILSIAFFVIIGIAVFRAVLDTKQRQQRGAVLAVAAVALELTSLLVPTSLHATMEVAANLASAAFFALVFSAIVSHVLGARDLKMDDLVGAFSGYIIIALIWGRLYVAAWIVVPGYFSINPDIKWQLANWSTLHTLFDFYSFSTISTIGYGNITTTGPGADTLVWLEVMCGQFYLAVVVATVVGIKMSQALASPRDGR